MKKIILVSLVTISTLNAESNAEYQKMLDVRANILGLPDRVAPALLVLIEEEETLNAQLVDLLQQLKTLDTTG